MVRYNLRPRRNTNDDDEGGGYGRRTTRKKPRDFFSSDTDSAATAKYSLNKDVKEAKGDSSDKTVIKVVTINLETKSNRKDHRTDSFQTEEPVIRRGQKFSLKLHFDRPVQNDDALILEFSTGAVPLESKRTKARSQPFSLSHTYPNKASGDPNQWKSDFRFVDNDRSVISVDVLPPGDSLIGRYKMIVETLSAVGNQSPSRYIHSEEIIVLFNPWSQGDSVYMESEEDLAEYMLNESGIIFVGSKMTLHSLPWNFGQFEEVALACALHLLEISSLTESARGNPAKISRMLSAMVNYNDRDGGILYGRWTETYPKNSTRPTAWVGSTEILEKFWKKKYMVRYGQCWVFAGVLCTLSRALGIPCRCVTNFDSAHDTDGSHSVDFHFTKDGKPIDDLNDSIWNFHVWNEVWMKRPDLPEGHDGWQAVDATPQETSEGVYQAGPASVTAIKNAEVYLPYDTGFLFAEVNADTVYWTVDEDGETMQAEAIDQLSIGKKISTKTVGWNSEARNDITLSYKHQEGSKEERDAARRAFRYGKRRDYSFLKGDDNVDSRVKGQEIEIYLLMPDSGMIGDSVEVTVMVCNKEEGVRTVNLHLSTRLVFYTGVSAGVVDDRTEVVQLKSKEDSVVNLEILPDMYLPRLEGSAGDLQLKVYARAEVSQTGRMLFEQATFDFEKPTINIQLSEKKLVVGEETELELSFLNPLPVALTDCEFHVEGICSKDNHPCFSWRMRDGVKANSRALCTGKVTPVKVGWRFLVARFQSDQLSGLSGKQFVEVIEKSSSNSP